MISNSITQPPHRALLAALVCWGLLKVNDLFLIGQTSYRWFLAVDYISKSLCLVALPILIGVRRWPDIIPMARPAAGMTVALIATIIAVDYGLDWLGVSELWPATRLTRWPPSDWPAVQLFDLTFGLALTAVVEEFVFRGVLLTALAARGWSVLTSALMSSLLFGAIHWSSGLGSTLSSTADGLVLCAAVAATRSIWPGVAAHFIVNLRYFW